MEATKKYGGFGQRLLAYGIDSLIITLLTYLVQLLFGFDLLIFYKELIFNGNLITDIPIGASIAAFLAVYLYYLYCWSNYSTTPGKSIMGLKIERAIDGKELTFGDSLLRLLGYIVSSIVFYLGFIWILFDEKKQGWHDKIAKTYVIETGKKPNYAFGVSALILVIAFSIFSNLLVFKAVFSEISSQIDELDANLGDLEINYTTEDPENYAVDDYDTLPDGLKASESLLVSLNSASVSDCINDCTYRPQGNKFLIIDVSIINNGTRYFDIARSNFYLVDEDGYIFYGYFQDTIKSLKNVRLMDGKKTSGELLFMLPEEQKDLYLVLQIGNTIFLKEKLENDKLQLPVKKKAVSMKVTSIDKLWMDDYLGGDINFVNVELDNTGDVTIYYDFYAKITDENDKKVVFDKNGLWPNLIGAKKKDNVMVPILQSVKEPHLYRLNIELRDQNTQEVLAINETKFFLFD